MTTTTMTMTKTARLHALWVHLAALLALLLVLGVLAPQARAQTTSVTFFHNDVLGSPAVATDANGAVVWKESYLPYGHRLQAPAAGANNKLWYAGKQLDPNTGLSYMGARYYSPVVGRFMGMDPKGIVPEDPHSFNRYAYANNNPYKYVDPDGRSSVLAVAGMGILVIGGAYYTLAPPNKQQEMRESIDRLARAIGNVLHSESSGAGDGAKGESAKGGANNVAPPVPGGLVGDQSSDSAGLTKNGKRHTSGPMTPGNGGTGDASKDFDKLTGGMSEPAGGTYPPGTLVGPNGVVLRPGQKGSGPRIDIPGNGSKPPGDASLLNRRSIMTLLLEFDTDGIASVQSMLRQGITGYAIDSLVPRGMSTIWLFLGGDTILKIYTTMTNTVGWNEVGTLVFRPVGKGDDVPEMLPLPQAWRNVTAIEKLLVVDDDFSAESGLQISNDLGEVFTIICSENVYRIEVAAPFFHGEFLPEYELTHYKHVPM